MANRLTKSCTLNDWKTLRENLRDKTLLNEDWNKAIRILKERIFERYLDPIKLLIDHSNNKGEGFTILTIECTLIEFIATLEDGRVFKRDKISTDLHCYYYKSAKIYQRFLKTASIFESYFFSKTQDRPIFTSHDFYLNVRCALIHEAQTKNNWEVKIFKNKGEDKTNKISFALTTDGKKLVYRTALYKSLENYFTDFVDKQLTLETNRGMTLRKFLARKIDHIAEIEPDTKFWWI